MIGNDIVDLVLAKKESNWKRNRFLDKIFTIKEQVLIVDAENPEKYAEFFQKIAEIQSRKI
mgnify:CR=1 FL=1